MLKLLFLLLVPGVFAEVVNGDIRKKDKFGFGKNIVHSLLFAYILFLIDATVIYVFFAEQYADFLAFSDRFVQTVQDAFLFVLLLFIQLLLALVLGLFSRIIRYRSIERAFGRMMPWQQNAALFSVVCSLLVVVMMFIAKDNAEHQLIINEVCSRNDNVVSDETGSYSDYIEIYNPSKWNILLKDFQVSDTLDFGEKLELGEVMIPPKGYSIVWIDSEGEDTARFGLSSMGDTVYLANAAGEVLDSVEVPQMEPNMAYARLTTDSEEWLAEVPTPCAENDENPKYLEEPLFSAESGFYDEEFQLSLTANEGEQIYYTLDGSTPDANSTLYTEAITVKNVSANPNVYRSIQNVVENWADNVPWQEPVDKAFIVRAVAIDSYGNSSDVVTKTYFVDMDEYKDGYVLSLVSDPDELFGDEGIYVTGKAYDDWYLGGREGAAPTPNFKLSGKSSEIETTVALFYNDLLMEQPAGLRIQGASQRAGALKRFSVFSRREYSGSRYFTYELFGEQMHSFFMRSDFEDALIHSLVTDRNVGTLGTVRAAVFLDGEFWYDTYLREKYSEDSLAVTYGLARENIRYEEKIPDEIYTFLDGHDLSRAEDYAQFCELIDVQSYIDYMSTNIYMANMDASEYKNCRVWKSAVDTGKGYSDGRWRWLIYDMDALAWNSIGYYQAMRHEIDSFAQSKQYAGEAYNQERIYKALRGNEEFCKQFVLTFMDMVNHNFSREKLEEGMTAFGVGMEWNDGFFQYRTDAIVPALAKEFALQGTLEQITVSTNDADAGYVTINTVTPDLTEGSWSGRYYTDYPVTITAVANEGYEFIGWRNGENTLNEAQISVQLTEGGCEWEAVFEQKERR